MKSFALAAAVLAMSMALATGRPQDGAHSAEQSTEAVPQQAGHPEVKILSRNFEDDGHGNFKWSFENSDGTKADAEGHTIAPENDHTDPVHVIQGSYSYVGSDGKTYSVSYVADHKGFQPMADFLPVAPVDPNHPTSAAAPSHA